MKCYNCSLLGHFVREYTEEKNKVFLVSTCKYACVFKRAILGKSHHLRIVDPRATYNITGN